MREKTSLYHFSLLAFIFLVYLIFARHRNEVEVVSSARTVIKEEREQEREQERERATATTRCLKNVYISHYKRHNSAVKLFPSPAHLSPIFITHLLRERGRVYLCERVSQFVAVKIKRRSESERERRRM
jgi:hypothetical protein